MKNKIVDVSGSLPGIKLDSFLKLSGEVQSGGQAKLLIQSGQVLVNGEVCALRGRKLKGGDVVDVRGNRYEVKVEEGSF